MAQDDLHVVPHPGGWAVRKPGASRATSVHQTQEAAIDAAKTTLRRGSGVGRREMVIHRRDGRIRDSRSYGGDPIPPRDKR